MIIKSKSYKSKKSFETVVNYILKEEELEHSFLLTRFIRGDKSNENITRQLYQNEHYRINQRKNSVKLFMDILSFRSCDSGRLDNNKLKKIARRYISKRANQSISLAVVHREKKHTHLHIVYSGVEYKTGKSVRISREDFKQLKLDMESYQKKDFPKLFRSAIDHVKSSKKKF